MAVLLAKKVVPMETVNDLNGDLINLALVLQSESLAVNLYERLSRTLMHEALFRREAKAWKKAGRLPATSSPSPDRAFQFFLCSWMGMNGVAGTASYNQGFCARFTKSGGHAATRFLAAVESIPAWHERLRSVTILSRCGMEIISKIEDDVGVVIYADPPYLVKGAKYVHDFEGADHQRLAELLRRFRKARVVVSYYADPRLNDLYPNWAVLNCPTAKALVSSGRRGKGRNEAPEVLLINSKRSNVTPRLFESEAS